MSPNFIKIKLFEKNNLLQINMIRIYKKSLAMCGKTFYINDIK